MDTPLKSSSAAFVHYLFIYFRDFWFPSIMKTPDNVDRLRHCAQNMTVSRFVGLGFFGHGRWLSAQDGASRIPLVSFEPGCSLTEENIHLDLISGLWSTSLDRSQA